jgi:hypothetical protein
MCCLLNFFNSLILVVKFDIIIANNRRYFSFFIALLRICTQTPSDKLALATKSILKSIANVSKILKPAFLKGTNFQNEKPI